MEKYNLWFRLTGWTKDRNLPACGFQYKNMQVGGDQEHPHKTERHSAPKWPFSFWGIQGIWICSQTGSASEVYYDMETRWGVAGWLDKWPFQSVNLSYPRKSLQCEARAKKTTFHLIHKALACSADTYSGLITFDGWLKYGWGVKMMFLWKPFAIFLLYYPQPAVIIFELVHFSLPAFTWPFDFIWMCYFSVLKALVLWSFGWLVTTFQRWLKWFQSIDLCIFGVCDAINV